MKCQKQPKIPHRVFTISSTSLVSPPLYDFECLLIDKCEKSMTKNRIIGEREKVWRFGYDKTGAEGRPQRMISSVSYL